MIYKAILLAVLWLFLPEQPSDISNITPFHPRDQKEELIAGRFDSLFTMFAHNRGFNGTVLVAHNGEVLYKHAFGYSDIRHKTPLSVSSEFQLASVSKQFTAVAIMMLHDRGLLDFGDPVQKFFPDFPYRHITVKHLLAHRSGLPNYMYFPAKYWKKRRMAYVSNDDVIDVLTKYHPAAEFEPDQQYRYSNTGYAVLASIVEKVTGRKFDEFMGHDVFIPLGMSGTFVYNPYAKQEPVFLTIGHNSNATPVQDDILNGVSGDKGVYSTVEDLFKWDQALYTEKLVRQSTLQEAFTPLSYDYKHNSTYGYGWRIRMLADGSKLVYHNGWWKGYNSMFVRRLEDKTSIIVLSNKVNWCFKNVGEMFGFIDSEQENTTMMGGD
ncbi:MAG: serine hydrolase domain-containing protein [Acidobacteriota bacterium]